MLWHRWLWRQNVESDVVNAVTQEFVTSKCGKRFCNCCDTGDCDIKMWKATLEMLWHRTLWRQNVEYDVGKLWHRSLLRQNVESAVVIAVTQEFVTSKCGKRRCNCCDTGVCDMWKATLEMLWHRTLWRQNLENYGVNAVTQEFVTSKCGKRHC